MSWNPLNTLTGRMVAVTVVSVAIAFAAAFLLFASERGAVLRRVAETNAIERIVLTAQRLRGAPPERRALIAGAIRDYGVRYEVAAAPSVGVGETDGRAVRIASAISQELGGADVRASARIVARPQRRRGEPQAGAAAWGGGHRERHRLVHHTEVNVAVALDAGQWLNARAFLPGPRPLPASALAGALASVLLVGLGAALVSRQIGRPLAQLASAARAFGAGEAGAAAPETGPDDVRRAAAAFNAMTLRLGRQLSRQRQMLWALSHDLRTPITAIRLRAELIEDEQARERLLAPIADMEALTEQALALARAGASEEPRRSVDLADIVRTLCGELRGLGVNIIDEAPAPVIAECRPAEIARALRNLAENAAKHGGGGVMRASSDAGEAIVEVVDEGPGAAPELLARLAEPFFRADPARGGDGAGLGLAIAQAIAEAHGGRLILRNREPRGFAAALVIPAQIASTAAR